MRLLFIAFAVLILMLQLTALSFLEIGSITPDFLLVLVVVCSLYGRPGRMLLTNWLVGLLKDLVTGSSLGTFAFLFMLVGLLVSLIKFLLMLGYDRPDYHKATAFKPLQLNYQDLAVRVVLCGGVIFLCHCCYGAGLYFSYRGFSLSFVFWRACLIACYTSFFAALVFTILQVLENYLAARRIRIEKDELKRSSPVSGRQRGFSR